MSAKISQQAKHIHVTCAIIERDDLVLATQRSAAMSMPYKWEFPGGKIDPGESAEECLRREIREEIGIEIDISRNMRACTHQYPSFTITLYPFVCTIEKGQPVLHEHADLIWLRPTELHTLDWAEADIPVLTAYLSERSKAS